MRITSKGIQRSSCERTTHSIIAWGTLESLCEGLQCFFFFSFFASIVNCGVFPVFLFHFFFTIFNCGDVSVGLSFSFLSLLSIVGVLFPFFTLFSIVSVSRCKYPINGE